MKLFINNPLPIVILVIIAIIFISIIYNGISQKRYFICPNCGNKFKASAKQLMLTNHACDEHYLKFPSCGKKAYIKERERIN